MCSKENTLLPADATIIYGLKADYPERCKQEKILYKAYEYFVDEGCRKYRLTYEDSFSAYSDAFLSAVQNIINDRFDGHSSLKTYFYQIFSNKCIDLVRKNTTNKNEVHKAAPLPEMLYQLPDSARDIIEGMMTRELKATIKAQLEVIGDKCKEILLLYEDGLTDREIAEQLSYNNAAVAKTTRLRCLEKLRTKVLV
ncbi:sigma-70 family RNA polymerase sigma factor [Ilyomonas limi]|uniref:Sigma-70 family RNA polymerase sigma factor n=1 Tax=Ilyomonas limi TaxID=2575867 RepID=A0A4U3KXS4_9BACT|nr:sigma-70 family RNA polymerase sigma factor [Ilyomonas limi]